MPSIGKLMTIKGFRRFLVETDGGEAGRPGNSYSCPIARYLQHHGVPDPSVNRVSVDHSRTDGWAYSFSLPVWARKFVHQVDDEYRDTVTGDQAVAILDEVTKSQRGIARVADRPSHDG